MYPEGPGLNYRAHTRVPEDNWTVVVSDGPRTSGGKVWYDTSRKAAGDPSAAQGGCDGGLERPRLQFAGRCPTATTANQSRNPALSVPDPPGLTIYCNNCVCGGARSRLW